MYFDWVSSECKNTTAPSELSTITATFSCVLLIITIPTNLLVILAFLIDPNKELRTQFNCFTFNLALADLLVGCFTELLAVYIHIRQSLDKQFGHGVKPIIQKVLHIPYFISAVASVLTIASLALERYLAMTSPFRYRQYFNVKLSIVLSIIIWIIAASFGLMNVFVEYILESFIFVNTALLFTGSVVCFAWFRIRSTLRQVSNNWDEIGMKSTREDGGNIQKKLTKTFGIIIGALMCCYIPVCSIVYYMNLCKPCNCGIIQWLRDAVFWLILLNSAINPFIYALRSSSFRNAIRIIIRCKCRRGQRTQRHEALVNYSNNKRKINKPEIEPRAADYGSISGGTSEEDDTSSSQRAKVIL